MDRMFKTVLFLVIVFVTGCRYAQPGTYFRILNVKAKPYSHIMAIAVKRDVVRWPKGFIRTFPNGGVPDTIVEEAKVYVVDVANQKILSIASFPNFDDVPDYERNIWLHGWKGGDIYFRIQGYEGSWSKGTDLTKKVEKFYRLRLDDDTAILVESLPPDLKYQTLGGGPKTAPYLYWSKGHDNVQISLDKRGLSENFICLKFDDVSQNLVFVDVHHANGCQ